MELPIAEEGIVDVCPVVVGLAVGKRFVQHRVGQFHTAALQQFSLSQHVAVEHDALKWRADEQLHGILGCRAPFIREKWLLLVDRTFQVIGNEREAYRVGQHLLASLKQKGIAADGPCGDAFGQKCLMGVHLAR